MHTISKDFFFFYQKCWEAYEPYCCLTSVLWLLISKQSDLIRFLTRKTSTFGLVKPALDLLTFFLPLTDTEFLYLVV